MAKNYNTRTASLKATIADILSLDAKQIDAEKIKLQGKDIKEICGFQDPEDFKKLCKRVNMDEMENEYYELLNDEGEIMYLNIPEGNNLEFTNRFGIKNFSLKNDTVNSLIFSGCDNLETIEVYIPNCGYFTIWGIDDTGYSPSPYFFSGTISKIKSISGDLSGCDDMTLFSMCLIDLSEFKAKVPETFDPGLSFFMSNLDSNSITHILNSLSEGDGTIYITMNEASVSTFNAITGNTNEIPMCDVDYILSFIDSPDTLFSLIYKGCTIYPSINVYTSENIDQLLTNS